LGCGSCKGTRMKATSEEMIAVSTAGAVAVAFGLSVIGAILAAFGHDDVIRFHGLLLAAASIAAGIYVLSHPRPAEGSEPLSYMDGPIKVATVAAVLWGVVGFLVGD